MNRADLHRLVDELPDEAVTGTACFLSSVIRNDIDPDQWWFWTPEWQAAERRAEQDIAAGRVTRFENDDALLRGLDALRDP